MVRMMSKEDEKGSVEKSRMVLYGVLFLGEDGGTGHQTMNVNVISGSWRKIVEKHDGITW